MRLRATRGSIGERLRPAARPWHAVLWRPAALLTAALFALTALAACAPSALPGASPTPPIHVLAAENFYGSLAEQLGGSKVLVTSVIANPNTDPHDYEPTVADARGVAEASLVVYNGAGYDPWIGKLLGANPNPAGRVEVNVGQLLDARAGANPHFWYSPRAVRAVIARITQSYKQLDPADASYFDELRAEFENRQLAPFDAAVTRIASNYAGVPVGASEGVVVPLIDTLRLDLVTPPAFLTAVSEGVDPTAADKATFDTQIKTRRIKVFIYNRQNSTPDVLALADEARAAGIPVVTVTETLEPAGEKFQIWQTKQLQALDAALAQSTGR